MRVCAFLLLVALQASAAYRYKRTVTVDHTKVANTDLANFPVLVKLSGPNFKSVQNGGRIQSTSAYDVGFYSDAGLIAPLPWEVDSYDPVNGTLWAWVRIPTLSHSADTVIYMGYGDAAIVASQVAASSVWDSFYRAVYHVRETAATFGSTVADSTANGNHLTTSAAGTFAPVVVAGPIGTAINLPHGHQYGGAAATSAAAAGHANSNTTVEGWFWLNSIFASDSNITTLFGTARGGYPYGYDSIRVTASGGFAGVAGADAFATAPTTPVAPASWHHVAMTYDHANVRLYLDGVQVSSTPGSFALRDSTFVVNGAESYYSDARYDELRFSSAARSADWIRTEYNNQSNPDTFCSPGPEQSSAQGVQNPVSAMGQPFIF